MDNWTACRRRRVFGYICRFGETNAENTTIPIRIEVMCRMDYQAQARKSDNLIALFFLVRGYSSNALIADSIGSMIGDPVTGVVTSKYGGSARAKLDSWRPLTDLRMWSAVSPDTFPEYDFGDFEDFAADCALALAGNPFAIDEPTENPTTGTRIWPPEKGPYEFIREMRERINDEDWLREAGGSKANTPDIPT